MERLTHTSPLGNRVSNGACADVQCDFGCDACGIDKIISKLWEYEETGLTPEQCQQLMMEIVHGIGFDRLKELANAEKDGRLKIVKKPPEGECCGNCADFIRTAGMASGTCRTQYRKRGGRTGAHRRVSQSTKACAAFTSSKETEARP